MCNACTGVVTTPRSVFLTRTPDTDVPTHPRRDVVKKSTCRSPVLKRALPPASLGQIPRATHLPASDTRVSTCRAALSRQSPFRQDARPSGLSAGSAPLSFITPSPPPLSPSGYASHRLRQVAKGRSRRVGSPTRPHLLNFFSSMVDPNSLEGAFSRDLTLTLVDACSASRSGSPASPLKKRADQARSRDEQRAPRGFAWRADIREWQGGLEHLCDYEIRRSGDRPKPDIGAGAEHRGSA